MATFQKRKRKDGTACWRVRVRLPDGRRKSRTFARKADAENWATVAQSKISSGETKAVADPEYLLGQAIDRYLREELPKKEPKAQSQQGGHLKWFKREIGFLPLKKVTPSVLSECKARLLMGAPSKVPRKGATSNRYFASLSCVFRIAMSEWEWCEKNPVRALRREKESRGIVRFLNDSERKQLLQACEEEPCPNIYPYVVLAISTGARRAELRYLHWHDVDLERGFITLNQTKNGEIRRVPVRGLALELLRKHPRLSGTDWVFPGEMNHRTDKPFFPGRVWYRVLEKAGIENFRFHDLRHSCASYLAMSGASLMEISEVLGHKSLSMVKRYAHLAEDHTARIVEKMNRSVFEEDQVDTDFTES
jgi:integrase